MNFDSDPAQQQWMKKMQAACDQTIGPSAKDVDREQYIPRENYQALVGSGFSGLVISKQYGGVGERTTTGVLSGEILAKTCPSTFFAFLSHAWRVGPTLEKFGTEQVKQNYLPGVATGQLQGGWAFAEPRNSTARFITTTARKTNDMFVLNGTKSFVTGASAAEFFIVIARLEDLDGPLCAFVVERRNRGLKRSDRINTVGMRGAHVADLVLEDCQVPASARLVTNETCTDLLDFSLVQSGIGFATLAAGIIDACMELSIERATTRKLVGGKKLGTLQEVHFKIAEMKTALDAVMQITLRAAFARDQNEDALMLANVAKVQAAESCVKAADDAMQIFGGDGYIAGSPIERYWRDARFLKIAGEPIEATRRMIALQELAKYQ